MSADKIELYPTTISDNHIIAKTKTGKPLILPLGFLPENKRNDLPKKVTVHFQQEETADVSIEKRHRKIEDMIN